MGAINPSEQSANGQPLFGVNRSKGAALRQPSTDANGMGSFDPKVRRKRPQWNRMKDDNDIDVELADIHETTSETRGRSLSDALVTQQGAGRMLKSADLDYAQAIRDVAR